MAAEEDYTIGYTYKKLTKSNQEKKVKSYFQRLGLSIIPLYKNIDHWCQGFYFHSLQNIFS